MWLYPATTAAGEFLTRPLQWGPWFLFVHAPYGYAVIGTSLLTLLLHSSAVAPAHRRSLFLLSGSAIVPVIATVAYDIGIGPNTISTLPFVFVMMLPIYTWLVVGEQIIGFSPIAYETVFQNMQDPVIVVDDQERIIGLNPMTSSSSADSTGSDQTERPCPSVEIFDGRRTSTFVDFSSPIF